MTDSASSSAIARARADDLAEVQALLRACALPDDVEAFFPDGYVIARQAGALVGCAGLERHGRAGLLRSVATAPALRGGGLARALIEERLRAARALGLDAVYLLTTSAAAYFERLGFAKAERGAAPEAVRASGQFQGGCCASAACLWRRP